MMKYTPYIMVGLSSVIVVSTNPLMLIMVILLMVFMVGISMTIMISSWAFMIMFLIYVGGLLVAISYFLALQPNQTMNISNTLALFIISSISLMLYNCPPIEKWGGGATSIIFIMNNPNLYLVSIIVLLLFIALLITVKVGGGMKAPLRPYEV